MEREALLDWLEKIGKEMVDSACRVRKELGARLLESVYEECMVYDLQKKGRCINGFLVSGPALTYLKQGKMRLGYLINFNVTLIKNGIKRFVV